MLEETRGIQLRIVPHRNGRCDAQDFEPYVDQRTRIGSVAWVSHLNCFRHTMRPIADLAHAHDAIFYADAVRPGMFTIDVQAEGVDALCCGSYKWMLGGFGIDPFYVRRDLVERELADHRYELVKTARRLDYCTRAFGAARQPATGRCGSRRRCSMRWKRLSGARR